MSRDPVWPLLDLGDIPAILDRPLVPPGPPTVDPALGGHDDKPPLPPPTPAPWPTGPRHLRAVA